MGAYFIGVIPCVIIYIVSYVQENKFSKEIGSYLSGIDINDYIYKPKKTIESSTESDETKSENNNKTEIINKLEKLGDLREKELISEEEFKAKKASLLDTI